MNILAIETASEACSVAVGAAGERWERHALAPRGHAERVLPWAEELMGEAGLDWRDLDAIAFSRGPGSFTSLRIGISLVQGLAWGAGLPVVPLSSLRIAAQVACPDSAREVVVAMDARMGEVFCGHFAADAAGIMRPAGAERVCSPKEAAEAVVAGQVGVGNGFRRFPELAEAGRALAHVLPDVWPSAVAMLPLAEDWLSRHEPLPANQAQPVYLRDKVADKPSAD